VHTYTSENTICNYLGIITHLSRDLRVTCSHIKQPNRTKIKWGYAGFIQHDIRMYVPCFIYYTSATGTIIMGGNITYIHVTLWCTCISLQTYCYFKNSTILNIMLTCSLPGMRILYLCICCVCAIALSGVVISSKVRYKNMECLHLSK